MTAQERHRFRRSQRLKRGDDFRRVFARRCVAANDLLKVHADVNQVGYARLGISVSRRLGGAVARNRGKRRLREAFRNIQHRLPAIDLVGSLQTVSATVADYKAALAQLAAAADRKLRRTTPRGEAQP